MRGTAEVLSWSAGDDAHLPHVPYGQNDSNGQNGQNGTDDRPARVDDGDLHDFGDLRDLGEPPASGGPRSSRSGRVPRAAWWLLAAGVAAAVVLPALRSPDHHPTAAIPDGGRSSSAFVVPSVARPQSLPDQMTIAALDPNPLHDGVRFGSKGDCPILAVGAPNPVARAMKAVTAISPNFDLLDSSRTIDQYSGLCLLQLRATNHRGTVLVLIVVPPNVKHPKWQPELLSMQSSSDTKSATTTASDLTSLGWRVSVGAVGPPSVQPNMSDLEQISASKGVLW